MDHINGKNVPDAYIDGLWKLRACSRSGDSRNGPVLAMPGPTFLTIDKPWERVLVDDIRQPNPYFHLAEFVWMMAGSNDARWLSDFNSNMMSFSDDGLTFKAAYGHRWRRHFDYDQIKVVIGMLKKDSDTRRACIAMWDPSVDLLPSKDVPCNTTIYFRRAYDGLDMTVCNRSNDYIWGMMGANCVHMTMLQEFICLAVGMKIGRYQVFTNNLHIYKDVPKFTEIMGTIQTRDLYEGYLPTVPLLHEGENPEAFLQDCEKFIWMNTETRFEEDRYETKWFQRVFLPMMRAYAARKRKEDDTRHLNDVIAPDWRQAGYLWKQWRAA